MQSTREEALAVLERLRGAGHEAFFVGGCVRDRLLGLPVREYDIATSASPGAIEALFRGRTVSVGRQFGVIVVNVGRHHALEVATFRSDGTYSDRRRPDTIHPSDARGDVLRRDLTINGLLEDPLTGEVLDYVGGRQDIERRIIRAIGDAESRFSEDRLRMLRTVRFAARLGFTIEDGTLRALERLAPGVREVSAERIRDEIQKSLGGPGAGTAFALLASTGLLDVIAPRVAALRDRRVAPHRGGQPVFGHIERALQALAPGRSIVGLAVLLGELPEPDAHAGRRTRAVEEILRALRASGIEIDSVRELVRLRERCFAGLGTARSALLAASPVLPDHLELHRVEALASGRAGVLDACLASDRARGGTVPEPLLRGEEVIAAGIPRGPSVGAILRRIRAMQLAGRLATHDEAVAYAAQRATIRNRHP